MTKMVWYSIKNFLMTVTCDCSQETSNACLWKIYERLRTAHECNEFLVYNVKCRNEDAQNASSVQCRVNGIVPSVLV